MSTTIYKIFIAATMLLFAIDSNAKRELSLWTAIRDMGILYRQGERDSSYAQAQQLLITANKNNDDLAQAVLYNFIGICLDDRGDKRRAMEEYEKCVAISEKNNFLEKAKNSKLKLYYQTMLNAYGQLVLSYNANGKSELSLQYAKIGMEWVNECKDATVRLPALSVFTDELMEHKEYAIIYEPMKHGVQDALRLGKNDFALKMSAHLIKIENDELGRDKKDIPWVRVGKELVDKAKTEDAKTSYLAAVNLDGNGKEAAHKYSDTLSMHRELPIIAKNMSADKDKIVKDSIQKRVKYIKVRNERIGIAISVIIAISGLFLIYVLWQRRQRRIDARLAEQAKEESYRDGQETERGRLARELHDGVSNQLLAIEMKLNEDGLTPQTMQLLTESREQIRRVSHELIPPEFEHTDINEVLDNYTNELNGIHGCQITFSSLPTDADWTIIPKTTALEIYRIIQEAVANSLRHSGATMISVGIRLDKNKTLTAIISDDGKSGEGNNNSKGGIGKHTISQRSSAINGKIEFYHHSLGNVVKLTVDIGK